MSGGWCRWLKSPPRVLLHLCGLQSVSRGFLFGTSLLIAMFYFKIGLGSLDGGAQLKGQEVYFDLLDCKWYLDIGKVSLCFSRSHSTLVSTFIYSSIIWNYHKQWYFWDNLLERKKEKKSPLCHGRYCAMFFCWENYLRESEHDFKTVRYYSNMCCCCCMVEITFIMKEELRSNHNLRLWSSVPI